MGENGRNFCRDHFWGYQGPYMTKIWIFGKPPKWSQKASLCIKSFRTCLKRAWGGYFHPTGTLGGPGPKPKISRFWPLNPQVKISDVPYGCKYSPQAIFLQIFDFFGKNRMFFIPWSLLSVKNSLSSDDLKKVNLITFHGQNSDFGEIVAGRQWLD